MIRKNLVLLPDIEELNEKEVSLIVNAEWYETKEGILLACAREICFLSEADPSEAGINVKKAELIRIPQCLKRFSVEDGFYHA